MSTRCYSKDKDIDAAVAQMVRQGWSVRTGGKHPKLVSPRGFITTIPFSPSDRRASRNFAADLRRIQQRETK